jgi:hypothetical protein
VIKKLPEIDFTWCKGAFFRKSFIFVKFLENDPEMLSHNYTNQSASDNKIRESIPGLLSDGGAKEEINSLR